MLRWSPPLNPPAEIDLENDNLPGVDIVITTYKEDIDEIAGTVNAALDIEWPYAHIYVLDDADREDVAVLCSSSSGRHRLTHITRCCNDGRKGGNINHWLKLRHDPNPYFITLDADMRPFPHCVQYFFSFIETLDMEEKEMLGFVQTPQFFRNYAADGDVFDVCNMHFIKTIAPAMSKMKTMPYVGTGALWNRQAITKSGYFFENHATEDVVTGCRVHRERFNSYFLAQPIAAGISPRTLPQLIDQHIRWDTGLVQMTFYHRFFLFARGLKWRQRLAYLGTCGGWIFSLIHYTTIVGTTLVANITIAIHPAPFSWTHLASIPLFLVGFCAWLLNPGASMMQRYRGLRMSFVYWPGTLVALWNAISRKRVKTSSESRRERFHPVMVFHVLVLAALVGSSIFAITTLNPIACVQGGVCIVVWLLIAWPIFVSILGGANHEATQWTEDEQNRPNLNFQTFSNEDEKRALVQMKQALVEIQKRIQVMENRKSRKSLNAT
mmetsp:Transcript_3530/g.8453  ORF Transcript_3530/g.8453 Transcript_3530/m.8453 type:complete len:495 (+) Transcript_3530:310-1794(+)